MPVCDRSERRHDDDDRVARGGGFADHARDAAHGVLVAEHASSVLLHHEAAHRGTSGWKTRNARTSRTAGTRPRAARTRSTRARGAGSVIPAIVAVPPPASSRLSSTKGSP